MAKQRFGINDGYRGSVGTVIGYMWRGKWCLRSRPRSVRNPRTERQQMNRELFRQMVLLASAFKTAVRKGMHHNALEAHMTECNLFVKENKQCFALGADGRLTAVWADVVVSQGEVAAVGFREPVVEEGNRLTVSFSPTLDERRGLGDDEVYLWAFCPEAGKGVLSGAASRRNGSVSIALPDRWQGKEVQLYGFVTDYKGCASETVYIGALEPETAETSGELGEFSESRACKGQVQEKAVTSSWRYCSASSRQSLSAVRSSGPACAWGLP